MNHESLRTLYESQGSEVLVETVAKAIEEKKMRPEDVDLLAIAETTIGPNWIKELQHYQSKGRPISEAVDVTAFNGITGQIYFTTVKEAFSTAPQELRSRVRVLPSDLSGEKIPIPGLSARYGYDIHAGERFPEDNFGRHWIETPRSAKSGKIISLTFEAVRFGQVGFALQGARDIGRMLGESIELRLAACLAGVDITLDGKTFDGNPFKWCKPNESSATAYDTYQTTDTGAGVNKATGVTLADETDIEDLFLLATAMKNPDTQQPAGYAAELRQIVCTPWNARRVRRIMNATEVRENSNSDDRVTIAGRGIRGYDIVESIHLYNALINSGVSTANAAEHFYLTNLDMAMYYIQNEPLRVEEQPALGDAAFDQHLVWRGRAWEMGAPAVVSPWHMYQSINA